MESEQQQPRATKEQQQQRNKVILLIDMDCFYVQVEQRDKPSSRGTPCAVVQYKKFKGGR